MKKVVIEVGGMYIGPADGVVPYEPKHPCRHIGGGGKGTGARALDEAFDSTDSYLATQRALVLTVALV